MQNLPNYTMKASEASGVLLISFESSVNEWMYALRGEFLRLAVYKPAAR
jgi:hypothetical protein